MAVARNVLRIGMHMQISACLVSRNHAHCLGAALDSLKGIADEVILADTGSTDETVSIAENHGAKIVLVPWDNDFAAVGNAAFAAASQPWILWMNPDEVLALPGPLAKAIQDEQRLAYTLRVQQQLNPDHPAYGTASYQWRLFQKHDRLRLRGRLHPHFEPALPDLAPEIGKDVGNLDTILVRHAYHSQVTPDKIRWTNRLIEAELQDRPDQLLLEIEWASNLLLLGEEAGHEKMGVAATKLSAALQAGGSPSPGTGPLIEYLLTVPTHKIRGPINRETASKLALSHYLRTPPIVWALAGERYQAKDFATASSLLNHLLEMGQSGEYDHALNFDPGILGADAKMNLGQCLLQLNRAAEARDCFAPLTHHVTHGPRATELLAIAEQLS
ncbi:MAG: glycosyltransferase [Fimbriiglobus sp.]